MLSTPTTLHLECLQIEKDLVQPHGVLGTSNQTTNAIRLSQPTA
jgi:hypothetical protein